MFVPPLFALINVCVIVSDEKQELYEFFFLGRNLSVFFFYFEALFSSPRKPKNFQDFLSHRILWHMHEILNIDENKN